MKLEIFKEKLEQAFPQSSIEAWDMTGSGDHFQVTISSAAFENLNRIQRHKKVMAVFDKELASGEIHALTIQADTPAQNKE